MAGDSTLGDGGVPARPGFRTYRSQIRVNVGCTREAADRLERRLEAIATRRNRKVTIVGHSLGGMLARGLAARRPDLIEGIVTHGQPGAGAGRHPQGARAGTPSCSRRLQPCRVRRDDERRLLRRGVRPAQLGGEPGAADPDVAFTAIYSKRDGIVDWRACLDPAAEHVEVRTSHFGMAVDPVVLDHVLDGAARAPAQSGGPAGPGWQLLSRRWVRSAPLTRDRSHLHRAAQQPGRAPRRRARRRPARRSASRSAS